jgi:CDP-glycerol glycerophosphotransferase
MVAVDKHLGPGGISILRKAIRRLLRRSSDAEAAQVAAIRKSGLFDIEWYLHHYPDVAGSGTDPIVHYVRHGATEGRNPSGTFNTGYYLSSNPDVAESGMNPLQHFVEFGCHEERKPTPAGTVARQSLPFAESPPISSRTAFYGDEKAVQLPGTKGNDSGAAGEVKHVQPALRRIFRNRRRHIAAPDQVLDDIAVIETSQLFNKQWYLERYQDVAASGMDPLRHYVKYGAAEGRNPSADFDTRFYVREDPRILWANLNPLRHYIEIGAREGRATLPPEKRKITTGPLVSIVIPVYGVEEYIAECLESVVSQTYSNLEIIIVDDGSPDHSYDIARTYEVSDPRIKILRQENGGLGAARNTGVAAAKGPYLTFVDSDDTLPPDAIARMMSSLQQTGSDFVVGAIRRVRHGKSSPAEGWVRETHAEDRARVRLEDFPEILTDVFVWNKVFKTNFFREKVGSFPERIRYEDQEPTARAYLNGTFDVLAGVVYYWRVREDGSSITQNKSNPDDLRDRLTVKQRVSHVLSKADAKTYGTWLAKAVGFDLRPYFEQVPRTNVEFFSQLREGMLPLAERMTPQLWQKVRMIDRLPALAVLAGHRDDVCVAITRRAEYGYFVPGRFNGGSAYLDRKYLEGMKLSPDDEMLKFGDADLSVATCATSLFWHGTRLHIEGYAYLTNLEFGDQTRISARLISEDRPPVELNLQKKDFPQVDVETSDAWNAHAKSGFVIDIDPKALRLDTNAIWRLEVTVSDSALKESRCTILRDADSRGIVATSMPPMLDGRSRWEGRFEPQTGFLLQCRSSHGVLISSVDTRDGVVAITTGESTAQTLLLTCETLRARVEVPAVIAGSKRTFRFRLPDLRAGDNREHIWNLHLGEGNPQKLIYPGGREDLEREAPQHHRIRAEVSRDGTLLLVQNFWWAIIDEIDVGSNAITARGRIDSPEAAMLSARLVGETQALDAENLGVDFATGRFEARIPFDPAVSIIKQTAPVGNFSLADAEPGEHPDPEKEPITERSFFQPSMSHGFSLRFAAEFQGHRYERWLRVASNLEQQLPIERKAIRYRLNFTRTAKAGALWVKFRMPYKDDELGRLAQHRLHAGIWCSQKKTSYEEVRLQDAVLFESFGGKQVSDSVLAICREIMRRQPSLDLYWTVSDLSMAVPQGAKPLLVHSRDWMQVLRRARYLVNNNNFPFYFRKSPGQVYLQTWHGTPLKKIGNDVPSSNLSLPYWQLMRREAGYWDFLLAQNDFSAEILPNAFGYAGRVLNLGYPRNDALIGPRAALRRLSMRNHFGFEPYHFVVLYAPTWRDNLSGSRGYSRVNYLDFKGVRQVLGNNARFILRGHHNTSSNLPIRQSGVIDATHHPDINDLILAADLLITDYSSIMFDYAVTGKPMVFLTPDLDQYRDQTRGFYMDFGEIAPGPICRTNIELYDVLGHLGATMDVYVERYTEFKRRFAPQDDGEAATRVVEAVWKDDGQLQSL